ncbi:hypothetical protein GGD56_003514 [Rhizobium mongolense]|jgi:hypothetical protein|uniref:Uncharacterized protein n=1 Tax=Rhizobium mongolense TaxID=57676 RepID=A0A7W6WEX2_9HYPH|nr:hypothetical protein [Rhizobium mongolense]MBB4275315.1 hypothetical protein [Rhizobium mongolense]
MKKATLLNATGLSLLLWLFILLAVVCLLR